MKDLISIIIPVYNVDSYLRACLLSVVNQTYKNIEIIIINDGSSDNSGIICEEFAKSDSRIRYHIQNNMGLSGARNTGIDIATGKYIMFVDSDDTIKLNMVEYLYDQIITHNAQIAVCQSCKIDENGNKSSIAPTKYHDITIKGKERNLKFFMTQKSFDVVSWGKLYHIDLFKKVRFPLGKYHEDMFTTYRIVAEATTIRISKVQLYNYRLRPTSIMHEDFSIKSLDLLEASRRKYKFIKNYYPRLKNIAASDILYSCNQCALKLSKGKIDKQIKKRYIKFLQIFYRKYFISSFSSPSKLSSKIFMIMSSISLSITLYIYNLFKK